MTIRRGDVLVCDGKAARFHSYNIANNTVYTFANRPRDPKELQFDGPLSDEAFPTPSKWGNNIQIIQEDCLGLCWLSFLAQRAVDAQTE